MIPVFIIQWIVGRSGGRLAARGAKILVYALIAVAVVAIILLAIAKRDNRIIATHDAVQDMAVVQGGADAAENASVSRRNDDATLAAETSETEKVIRDAPPPSAPTSAARAAYYRCVRLQQQSRTAGVPAPKC